MFFHLKSLDDTARFGSLLAEALLQEPALRVVLLSGDLGSGKTTMTRAFVAALPGGDDAEVSSPSFNLCNMYPTSPEMAHFDLYRTENGIPDDALLDFFDEGTHIVFVEWAERIDAALLPPIRLHLEWQRNEDERVVCATAFGVAALAALTLVMHKAPDLVYSDKAN